ncbi:MAG: acetylglutamate kinase [Chloroflexota bacterium]
MLVLKVGGNEIDDPDFVEQFGKVLDTLSESTMVVHGGGKEIKQLQEKLGLEAQYIDGLRVTDEESLVLVQMVLAGRVNKRLVAALSSAGLDVFGMSGIDRASIQAEKLEHPSGDLGYVGKITHVKADVFHHLLRDNIVPIVSPICYGPGGDVFNVNADHVALAVAIALDADQLVFLTNVPGVLHDGDLLPDLTPAEVEALISEAVIFGGMIPKVRSALDAVDSGVQSVRITNLDGLKAGTGTVISKSDINSKGSVTTPLSQPTKAKAQK